MKRYQFVFIFLLIFSCKPIKNDSQDVTSNEVERSQKHKEVNLTSQNFKDFFKIESEKIKGDFNGDGNVDTAILVSSKNQGSEKRILVFHSDKDVIVIGENDGVSINGMIFISINNTKVIYKSIFHKDSIERKFIKINTDAIYIGGRDNNKVGTIYWNVDKYDYINEGT